MTRIRVPCSQSLYTLYDGEPHTGCRTGVPVPSGGTTALSAYHAYKSYLFFDSDAVTAALAGGSVLSLGLDLESAGDPAESPGTFPLRFYRTDLTQQSSLVSAHSGLSAVQTENAHFAEYGELTAPEKGQSAENAVFMTGEAAVRTAEALSEGCALGVFILKSGRTFSNTGSPWRVRHLENLSLVITLNTSPDTSPPPRALYPRAPYASGENTALCYESESAQGGLLVSYRDRENEDAPWGAWSGDALPEAGPAPGTVLISAPPPGAQRLYRAKAAGGISYTECAYPVTGLPLPVLTRVTPVRTGRRVIFSVEGSTGQGGARVMIAGGIRGFLGEGQACAECEALFEAGETEAEVLLVSVYGGSSTALRVKLPPALPFSPQQLTFRGIRGEDLGLRLLSLPEPVLREKGEYFRSLGREKDAFVNEGDDVYEYSETVFTLYSDGAPPGARAAEYLSGEGDAVFSPFEDRVYSMRVTAAAPERFMGDGGVTVRVQALLSPFYRRADECAVPLLAGENSVYNAGCTRCFPLIFLECGGEDSVSVNGSLFRVYGQEGTVVIDTEARTVTGADGQLAEDTEGDCPFLEKGENTVTLSPGTSGRVLCRQKYL